MWIRYQKKKKNKTIKKKKGFYCDYLTGKGANVISIDNSPTMIEITKNRVPKAKVIQADMNDPLDFIKEETIDIILAPLSIHYIKNWEILFKELSKRLKKNGVFIFSTHNPHWETERLKVDYFDRVLIHDYWEGIGTVSYYHHTLSDILNSLSVNGFRVDKFLEPFPSKEIQINDPKLFQLLSKKSLFLFVRAIKF